MAQDVGYEASTPPSASCLFSVDVEDWFHILDLPSSPNLAEWDQLPSRVEANFRNLLDLFDEHGAKVTCFFLGWVAKRFPNLLRDAAGRGHEIASHGLSHQLVYSMTPNDFFADISEAKSIIEDAVGKAVSGYRCPGFSVTEATPWFFDLIAKAGYSYDSSVFPAPRGHGGLANATHRRPYVVESSYGRIVEVPISVVPVPLLGRPMCFFGGGYLRLFPYRVINEMTARLLREGSPVTFYVHPREIDPGQPKLKMGLNRHFKSYVGLRTTRSKIDRLMKDFSFRTFGAYADSFASVPAPQEKQQ
ncbi:MAG: polysaccharide deacetylase family protein [Deltaproteobacteria bacterium]|nr:polysaccharide deacetylase family protein [Deltaproteobacteria bacterium]